MLRLLAYVYFAIGVIEIALVPLGEWGPMPGVLAGATSIFFGAVLLGLVMIVNELRALRLGQDGASAAESAVEARIHPVNRPSR